MKNTIKPRNEQAAALRLRAGNAGAAISVDTRPKVVPDQRKKSTRKAVRAQLKSGKWD